MPINILMPALSPTMETGILAKWHVKEGDEIVIGDILAEIETDKATMEFEAIEDGKITKILVPEGSKDIKVNSVIAELTIEGEMTANLHEKDKILVSKVPAEPSIANETSLPTKIYETGSTLSTEISRIKISPLARRIASNHNLEIINIVGSGPQGRIIKKDVIDQLEANSKPTKDHLENRRNVEKSPNKPDSNNLEHILAMFHGSDYELLPVSSVRKIVANRLSHSKKSIPHFYLRRSIALDKLITLRKDLNQSLSSKNTKLTINDFIIKAAAQRLQDNPKCNAVWAEDNIIQLKSSDISVAVAIEDGLITPIVRNAEKKSLTEISLEMKDKAQRAQTKKLLPEEYTGGSFSISNLGMMGVESFDAVINPPQASILAVGSVVKSPVVDAEGEINVGQIMCINLSADHRVIDGAVGAHFINSIVEYLSHPLRLLV